MSSIRRITTIAFVVSILTIVGLSISFGMEAGPSTTATTTHTVCLSGPPVCDFSSVQAAVDASTPGDRIIVDTGIYTENVTIGITLTLEGASSAATIVDGNALGSVFTINSGCSVTITGVTIANGKAVDGGGIRNSGTLVLADSTIEGNNANSFGGGVFNAGALTLVNSTLSGNEASVAGGGLFNDLGGWPRPVMLNNVTISGNTAGDDGGGLFFAANVLARDVAGDDVLNVTANGVAVQNSTVSDNSAGSRGGGIFSADESVTLYNTIVADNLSGGDCYSFGSGLSSLGYNLDSDNTCHLTATGDITDTSPLLGALQDNGGPTLTHALLVGSPAIDAGECDGTTSDQRGMNRPVDIPVVANAADGCDIGALEVQIHEYLPFHVYLPLALK